MNSLYPVQSLKEDVFEHLDMVFRSARRSQNYGAALKAVEIALKAKRLSITKEVDISHPDEMSDAELECLLKKLNLS